MVFWPVLVCVGRFVVIAVWVLAAAVAGGLAVDGEVVPGPEPLTDVLDAAVTSEFRLGRGAESVRADVLLEERLQVARPISEVVIVQSGLETVDSPGFRAKVEEVYDEVLSLGSGTVAEAFHFYQSRDPSLVAADGKTTIMPLVLAGGLDQAVGNVPAVLQVVEDADGEDGFRVLMVGEASTLRDYNELAASDLEWGERIGVPVALVILVGLFGTIAAAFLPLGLSLVCIVVALGAVALIGQAFELILFVALMVVMIGLAVGIDYSLLLVSRFRDELARGLDKNAAIERACARAGRTVLFSGVTVVVALCGLLIVPLPYLQSLALGAIVVVLVSLAGALTLLPACLALLGPRINLLPVPFFGESEDQTVRDVGAGLLVPDRPRRYPGAAGQHCRCFCADDRGGHLRLPDPDGHQRRRRFPGRHPDPGSVLRHGGALHLRAGQPRRDRHRWRRR